MSGKPVSRAPPPETLADLDILRDLGVKPDALFLLQRVRDCDDQKSFEETFRRAILELLCNCRRLRIPLSQRTLGMIAGELDRLWWPGTASEEKSLCRLQEARLKRADLEVREAVNRWRGIPRPRGEAKKDVAKYWGHSSDEALRKNLQANRAPKPRRKQRG